MIFIYFDADDGLIKGKSAEEKLKHMERFLKSILNQKQRPLVLILIMMRNKIKKLFNSRELVLIIEGKYNLFAKAVKDLTK